MKQLKRGSGFVAISANVLTLGEEADLKAQTFDLAQMLIESKNVEFSTKPAFLPNVCYAQVFLLIELK
jgi:hypothetical protein